MKRFWGNLTSILMVLVLFVAVPTSTFAMDSEHRDLLQSIMDSTGTSESTLSDIATSTASIDTDTSTIAGDTTSIDENQVRKATTPVIYNVTMTLADTEYSQALPEDTKKFLIHTRDSTTFRLAFETGKVAAPTEPYFTVPASSTYFENFVDVSSLTLYFACDDAGKIIEIITWS